MMTYRRSILCASIALTLIITASIQIAAAGNTSSKLPVVTIASTVPPNGDLNPYGVAVISTSVGKLVRGHTLVSNFNNSANLQGTGSTIVDISPAGVTNVFAAINASALPGPCPGGVGLTTALVALKSGWVIVGSLPTTDGTAATAQAGCLIVLDSSGNVMETITDTTINGPWDMTALETGTGVALFVSNVLNGTVAGGGNIVDEGTVIRINLDLSGPLPSVQKITTIGSGFPQRTDPAALVIGPTGLHLGSDGTLYVADSLDNRIAAIAHAANRSSTVGIGRTVSVGGCLNDPLGLTVRPDNGDVLTTNGNNGFLVETTPSGQQVAMALVDDSGMPPGAGTLFGLAATDEGVVFVDDGTNTLNFVPYPNK